MSYHFLPERINKTKEMKLIDFMEKFNLIKEVKKQYLGKTKFLGKCQFDLFLIFVSIIYKVFKLYLIFDY